MVGCGHVSTGYKLMKECFTECVQMMNGIGELAKHVKSSKIKIADDNITKQNNHEFFKIAIRLFVIMFISSERYHFYLTTSGLMQKLFIDL